MSIVLEEIRSAIVGGKNHPNLEGDERDEDEGEETMDEYNKGPMRGDQRRTMVGQNVNPRGYEVLKEEQVKVVPYMLRGGAGAWWQREQDNRRAQGRRPVDTWMRMKGMIKADYTGEFSRLQSRCNLREMDEQFVARYISGLNSSIQERLSLMPIWFVDQAQNMAMKAEMMSSKTGVGFRRSNMKSLSNYGSQPNPIQSTIYITTTTTSSSKASESGGNKNKESQPINSNPYARPTGAKCFRCGKPGHRSNVCPKRSTYYSVESRNDGLTVDEAFQEEDVLEYSEPLDGEAEQVTYVIQRALCSPKALESKTLVTLVASPKEFQAKKKETGVSYALVVKGVEDVMKNAIPTVVKPLLAEFSKIVVDDTPDALPPIRNIQHQIDLIPRASLPNLPHYRMSPKEFEILLEKIEELLKKGHIQESISPCTVLALLTPKKDGARLFSKIDLRSGYHQIRIKLGDEWKTAFKTKDGFQAKEEHLGHLQKVMKALADNDLFVNLKKCNSLTNKLLFLGYIMSSDGIHVDETKVQSVRDWPSPNTLFEVRSFHR
nr:hypothetical protein [Tanacetum cinerariifolium]